MDTLLLLSIHVCVNMCQKKLRNKQRTIWHLSTYLYVHRCMHISTYIFTHVKTLEAKRKPCHIHKYIHTRMSNWHSFIVKIYAVNFLILNIEKAYNHKAKKTTIKKTNQQRTGQTPNVFRTTSNRTQKPASADPLNGSVKSAAGQWKERLLKINKNM